MRSITKKSAGNGPSFCWHCMKQLQFKKGGGFYFSTLVDQLGNKHRVHMDCVRHAIGDGVKELKA